MKGELFAENLRPAEIRANEILDAQKRIIKRIWSPISGLAQYAYSRLNSGVYSGRTFLDESFIESEKELVRSAFPAINAYLEEGLINRAIASMLDLNNRVPDESHVVTLFPPEQPEDSANVSPSAIDILKILPEDFGVNDSRVIEKAIQRVAEVVVIPDKLAEIGLHRLELYSSIIIGESSILSVPTIIKGVSLRHIGGKNPAGETTSVTQFVMDPVL